MTRYAIIFYDRDVPDYTIEETRDISKNTRALTQEMKDAGVLVFTGGLNTDGVFTADASSGEPVFTDGPYAEAKEFLGGICVIDVPTEAEARTWAGKVAAACTWPQHVHPFLDPAWLDKPDASWPPPVSDER